MRTPHPPQPSKPRKGLDKREHDDTMKMKDFRRLESAFEMTDEELGRIVMPPKTMATTLKRITVARFLMEGRPYSVIQEEADCSTAFVADVAKRLRANGLLRGWEQRGRYWLQRQQEMAEQQEDGIEVDVPNKNVERIEVLEAITRAEMTADDEPEQDTVDVASVIEASVFEETMMPSPYEPQMQQVSQVAPTPEPQEPQDVHPTSAPSPFSRDEHTMTAAERMKAHRDAINHRLGDKYGRGL